jgi:hypothetical protein
METEERETRKSQRQRRCEEWREEGKAGKEE